MRVLDILVVFRLDIGQSSFYLVENAFATQQLALLVTNIAFYDVLVRACVEIKTLTYIFRLFSFSFLFAALIDLPLGLLAGKLL